MDVVAAFPAALGPQPLGLVLSQLSLGPESSSGSPHFYPGGNTPASVGPLASLVCSPGCTPGPVRTWPPWPDVAHSGARGRVLVRHSSLHRRRCVRRDLTGDGGDGLIGTVREPRRFTTSRYPSRSLGLVRRTRERTPVAPG